MPGRRTRPAALKTRRPAARASCRRASYALCRATKVERAGSTAAACSVGVARPRCDAADGYAFAAKIGKTSFRHC